MSTTGLLPTNIDWILVPKYEQQIPEAIISNIRNMCPNSKIIIATTKKLKVNMFLLFS